MLLNEIIEIVCSPEIYVSVLPYLKVIIDEFLLLRKTLFPKAPLRPKHHYLKHYCELILKYGPLIKVWTLRFESKHMFFKGLIRRLQNFLNVTKTMSEKHELRECLIRLGADLRTDTDFTDISEFNVYLYHEKIQNCIPRHLLLQKLYHCSSVTTMGTTFDKSQIIPVAQDNYQLDIKFGKICFFIINGQTVYAIVQMLESNFIPSLRVYEIGCKNLYKCIPLNSLGNIKPMYQYVLADMICLKPKTGFVTKLNDYDFQI